VFATHAETLFQAISKRHEQVNINKEASEELHQDSRSFEEKAKRMQAKAKGQWWPW